MRKILSTAALFTVAAAPAFAADGPFFSLRNTDFVVLLAFILFVVVLLWTKVPQKVAGVLDARGETIRKEINDARVLREEAQTLLAEYERKQAEVAEQAARIVANARSEAEAAAVQAKAEIAVSVARRLAAAEEQIIGAQNAAIKAVRDRATTVAIAAARDVIAAKVDTAKGNDLIDAAIQTVEARLH